MPHRQQTRRTVLKTIGAGLGVGIAGVAPARANSDKLSDQLNTVRSTTRQCRDIETARANGYKAIAPYVPGMGFHFANKEPPFGTALADPGVLVYFTNGSYNPAPGDEHDSEHDDDLILGTVEWLVAGDQTDDPPDIFDDENSSRNLKVGSFHRS